MSENTKMTPDWLHQILWYISGICATGAVWYFLSQKNYHATIWTAYAAAVLALLAVALLIRNDVIRKEIETARRVQAPSEPENPFHVRYHTALVANYPGPLVYLYDSKLGKRLAPVGYAVVLEVLNNRATATKIHGYVVDIAVGNEWVRLPNLQALNPNEFFWIDNGNLKTCTRLDFTQTSFDMQARDRTLQPGESVRGWMFFEWPPELRSSEAPRFRQLRIQLENAQGERQATVVNTDQPQESGTSLLGGGAVYMPPQQKTDLSNVPILPHVDLLRGFKQGMIK